ncbi:MAG: hypothetical protein Q8R16_01280 [bacterium]|nr:hypothetical protein [bacterium]
MGHRTIKRVPLDFDWPIGEVWKGYRNPRKPPPKCARCDGSGLNPATLELDRTFYDHEGFGERWRYVRTDVVDARGRHQQVIVGACRRWCDKVTVDEIVTLAQEGRLSEWTHTWTGEKWEPKRWDQKGFWCPRCGVGIPQLSPAHHTGLCKCTGEEQKMLLLEGDDVRLHMPTPDEVNRWERDGMGHDAINRWILVETRAKRLGVWGKCRACHGKGVRYFRDRKSKAATKRYRRWRQYDPPRGPGWQLWGTTSEGNPASPVFATAEALAAWCAKNATVFASERMTKQEWLAMIRGENAGSSDLSMGSTPVSVRTSPAP